MLNRPAQTGFSLRLWSMALGALAFGFLLLVQLGVRYGIQIPAMHQLVDLSDQKDRARVESLLSVQLNNLLSRTSDNAIWDDAYHYVQHPAPEFIARSFDVRTLEDNVISGLAFIDANGRVLWSLGYGYGGSVDSVQVGAVPLNDVQLMRYWWVAPALPQAGEVASRIGYLAADEGPLMYAAVPVFPTSLGNGQQLSAGVLVMWRWLDDDFWAEVAQTTQLKVSARYLPRQLDSLRQPFQFLATESHPKRTADNQLSWLLHGPTGALMQIIIDLGDPPFNQGLISESLVAGMLAAFCLLLILGACVRHWLIKPLISLRTQMERINREGDYGNRLQVRSYDELNGLAEQFNHLLVEVQNQQNKAKRRQAELQLASISDGLTGLANRRYLDQFMDAGWERAKAAPTSFSLLLLDVDYFKDYNDHYGHDEGDEVLRQVARVLRRCQPELDAIAARYGGEEFCLVALGLDVAAFEALCERIRLGVLALEIEHQRSDLGRISVSLGAVYIDAAHMKQPQLSGRDALRMLFKAADGCLYRAKRQGRNQVQSCDWYSLGGD